MLKGIPPPLPLPRISLPKDNAQSLRQGFPIIRIHPYPSPALVLALHLPAVQPHTLDAQLREAGAVHGRRALALEVDHVRHVAFVHGGGRFVCEAAALLPRARDGGDEIGGAEPGRFAIETAVKEQDLEPRASGGWSDGVADATQDQ